MDNVGATMSQILFGDCRDVLKTLSEGSVDACVTDPPYGLGFMGKSWDHGVPGAEVLRVLRPGGHLVAFGGTRAFHRLACAIEDAGFELRDAILRGHTPEDCPWLDACGSGSTGKVAVFEGFYFIGIEREEEYLLIAQARVAPAERMYAEHTRQMSLEV